MCTFIRGTHQTTSNCNDVSHLCESNLPGEVLYIKKVSPNESNAIERVTWSSNVNQQIYAQHARYKHAWMVNRKHKYIEKTKTK